MFYKRIRFSVQNVYEVSSQATTDAFLDLLWSSVLVYGMIQFVPFLFIFTALYVFRSISKEAILAIGVLG